MQVWSYGNYRARLDPGYGKGLNCFKIGLQCVLLSWLRISKSGPPIDVTSLDAVSVVRLRAPPLRRRQHGFTLWIKSCDVTPDENTRHTREVHPLMRIRRRTIFLFKKKWAGTSSSVISIWIQDPNNPISDLQWTQPPGYVGVLCDYKHAIEMYGGLHVFLSLVLDGDDCSDSLPVCIIPKETTSLYWERLEGTSLECWLIPRLPFTLSPSMQIPGQYLEWTKTASFSIIFHHSSNHKPFIFWDNVTQNKPETIRVKPAGCPLNRRTGAPGSRLGHVDEETHCICCETKRRLSVVAYFFGRYLLFVIAKWLN